MTDVVKGQQPFEQHPGPILCLAGPGTGKTYQLTHRVKFLIDEKGVDPKQIAVITFTKEAAASMRTKLSKKQEDGSFFLKPEEWPGIISTMHSLGNSIICSKPGTLGIKGEPKVLSAQQHRELLLKDASHLVGLDRSDWGLADDCRKRGGCSPEEGNKKCRICSAYEDILNRCSVVDYDDQIIRAIKVLKSDENLRREWQSKTAHLLIDEFQDINQGQYELIKILSKDQLEGLFAVGDDDQSIYQFRGGDPKYIQEFSDRFGPKARVYPLGVSYRCPQHILMGARSVIEHYYDASVPKPTPTFEGVNEKNNKIQFYEVPSSKYEAWLIAEIAKDRIGSGEVIVLVPSRKYVPPIKRALTNAGLNYSYRRKIAEQTFTRIDIVGEWLSDQENNAGLRYLIDLIIANHDSLTKSCSTERLKISQKRQIASNQVAELWKRVDDRTSLWNVLTTVSLSETRYPFLDMLHDTLETLLREVETRGNSRKGIASFLETCGLLVAPGNTPKNLISEIRNCIQELDGNVIGLGSRPVHIYTMQSSKGLQAEVVLVTGLSKGIFPSPNDDMAEMARLLYVAMTRAESELHLFSSRSRPSSTTFGDKSFQLEPSPFIDSIPSTHIKRNNHYSSKKRRSR